MQGRDPVAVARDLDARTDEARKQVWMASIDPAAWADDSSRVASALYAELEITPQTTRIVRQPKDYVASQQPRVEEAIASAGVRLAALLNEIARKREVAPGPR
jgi:hypothetical protein